jgi:endonuclease III
LTTKAEDTTTVKDEEAEELEECPETTTTIITARTTTTKDHDPDYKVRVKRGDENRYGLTVGYSPYPHRMIPSPEDCEDVHKILTTLHGEIIRPEKIAPASLEIAGCGEVPSVLDALLRTLISGNTQMARANEAIKGLARTYGILDEGIGAGSINWNKVRLSSLEEVIEVIKPAGCAQGKGRHIKAILDMVYEENLASLEQTPTAVPTDSNKEQRSILSLDHFNSMTRDEAMTEFLKFPGIGVKTAACVILFCLRAPCFAVDTHVHKFCQWLGWVPVKANELDSFNHCEFMVPNHLKYSLHQLFIRHGQQCFKCRKTTKPGTTEWNEAPDCPLEHLLNRDKEVAKMKVKVKSEVDDDSESEMSE